MKKCYSLISAILLLGSVHCHAEQLKALENLVLCRQDSSVDALIQKMDKGDGFEKSGMNFYKPQKVIHAFGYEVAYIGLNGVDMVAGPNISVKGKYKDVEKSVKGIHKGEYNCGPGGCDLEIDKYNHLMIYPHPADKSMTIIQCGYLGP